MGRGIGQMHEHSGEAEHGAAEEENKEIHQRIVAVESG
jgi:hypothetical protein